jgi:hypothetical protein
MLKDSSFDPYVCLMRSSTFVLYRMVHFRDRMELRNTTLDLEASKAMTFASYAAAHSLLHRVQVRILDDINDLMTRESAQGQTWYDSMEHLTRQRGFINSFEDFALFLDLSGYIRIKIIQRGLVSRRKQLHFYIDGSKKILSGGLGLQQTSVWKWHQRCFV